MSGDFNPRWASPTGDTIRDVLEVKGLRHDEFAALLGVDSVSVEQLLEGSLEISVGMAASLTEHLGGSVHFWMARESDYRQDLRRLRDSELVESRLPLKHMMFHGWLQASDDWAERVDTVRDFFGAHPGQDLAEAIDAITQKVRLRPSQTFGVEIDGLASWLRQAQREAKDLRPQVWDPAGLRSRLSQLKQLSKLRDIQEALASARALLHSHGIALFVIPAPPGVPVSGAATSDIDGSRLIVLSGRYRSDDHLWFTFFHELGHHLDADHQGVACGDPLLDTNSEPAEIRADRFAAEVLLPHQAVQGLRPPRTVRQLVALARAHDVSPGVVLGQLQHRGIVDFGRLEKAKRRYDWQNGKLTSRSRG